MTHWEQARRQDRGIEQQHLSNRLRGRRQVEICYGEEGEIIEGRSREEERRREFMSEGDSVSWPK
jgi:hypothetical protein